MTLTAERVRQALDYDPETGVLTWRIRPRSNRCEIGQVAGFIKMMSGKGYIQIRLDTDYYLAHRLAWLHAYGRWPDEEIVHQNGNGLDNRLSNLCEVSRGTNAKNRRLSVNNSSGFSGVCRHKQTNKWQAYVKVNDQYQFLGLFVNKADAAEVARKARAENGFHPNHGTRRPL